MSDHQDGPRSLYVHVYGTPTTCSYSYSEASADGMKSPNVPSVTLAAVPGAGDPAFTYIPYTPYTPYIPAYTPAPLSSWQCLRCGCVWNLLQVGCPRCNASQQPPLAPTITGVPSTGLITGTSVQVDLTPIPSADATGTCTDPAYPVRSSTSCTAEKA